MLMIGGAFAALVLIIAGINLLNGRGGSTKVSLTEENRLALGSTFSMYIPSEGTLVTSGQNIPSLESDGLVRRTVHPVIPPHVDYALTTLGRTLGSAFCGVWIWAETHHAEIEEARRRFNEQPPRPAME